MSADFTGEQILAVAHPGGLFTADPVIARKEYQALARRWHPDHGREINPSIMAHINVLYDRALQQLATGEWETPGVFNIRDTSGKTFAMRYRVRRSFEIGETYIGNEYVAYAVAAENGDLFGHGLRSMRSLAFPSDAMRDEMLKYLPVIVARHNCEKIIVLVIRKSKSFALRDILTALGGKIEPRHMAWIISGLLNIACYFRYLKAAHADISIDSTFVDPNRHVVSLLGGWWYKATFGERFKALPERTISLLPSLATAPVASKHIDTTLIKAVGCELLADAGGSRLLLDASIPAPLVRWLRSPGGDAFEEYKLWQRVINASFGGRRFSEMKISDGDIYKE